MPPKTTKSLSDGAFDGVRTGYDLIENHIRRARIVAARYGKERAPKRPPDRGEDIKTTVAHVFRTLSELAPVIGGLINTIGAEGFAQALSGVNPLSGLSSGDNFRPAGGRVVVELSSKRRTTASCELRAGAERRRLTTAGLEARNGHRIAAKALAFTAARAGKPSVLKIRVPDHQPSGVYSGLLVDRTSSEPQGIVTLRIGK